MAGAGQRGLVSRSAVPGHACCHEATRVAVTGTPRGEKSLSSRFRGVLWDRSSAGDGFFASCTPNLVAVTFGRLGSLAVGGAGTSLLLQQSRRFWEPTKLRGNCDLKITVNLKLLFLTCPFPKLNHADLWRVPVLWERVGG